MDRLTFGEAAPPRRSSADEAVLYIRRLIFDGRLLPGERVPQDDVARALGISRIPVREALIALERGGWVTLELHRGAFVSHLDDQAVRDHYDLYGLVYGFAARRALTRCGPDLGDDLRRIAAEVSASDDPGAVDRLVRSFHDVVTGAARSPRIGVVLRAMSGLVPGNFFALVPGAVGTERRGLDAIARAIRRGDGDRAAEEYQRMMQRQGDNVVALFRRRGLLGATGSVR